jgi:membrane-bound ClpP family serine protease
MTNVIALLLAIVAFALMIIAILFMNLGDFGIAGVLFLTASLIIYFREKTVWDSV